MKYDIVIFDLDGTLLDTLDDLATATNRALTENGFATRTREEVRRFIGNGAARLIRRALPEGAPEAACARVLADFRLFYARDVNVRTRPYAGIITLLEALRDAGIKTAVNSNKPDDAVQALCAAHFPGLLSMALGDREGVPKKPAPDGANQILRSLDIPRERALYVGDGDTDLMTAENAGIDGAWVSWGFRGRAELGELSIPRAFDASEDLQRFILEP